MVNSWLRSRVAPTVGPASVDHKVPPSVTRRRARRSCVCCAGFNSGAGHHPFPPLAKGGPGGVIPALSASNAQCKEAARRVGTEFWDLEKQGHCNELVTGGAATTPPGPPFARERKTRNQIDGSTRLMECRRFISPWLAWLLLALAVPANAQESPTHNSQDWLGKRVITKFGAVLRVGKEVVDNENVETTALGRKRRVCRVYRVEHVHDRWLWLQAEQTGAAGWMTTDWVIPYDQAIEYFTSEIRINPNRAMAYIRRGHLWRYEKELDKAIADYEQAIRLTPADEICWCSRGMAWYGKKEYDKAIADYDEAIRLDPKYPLAYSNRGNAWYKKKEYDRAIADFGDAIRLDPKDAVSHRNRGLAWYDKQEYDKAIVDLDEAIRLDSRFAMAYNSRGAVRLAKKEYDKAIPDLNAAIRLNPKDALAYNNRGIAWSGKKEYDNAITDHSEAIRRDPTYSYAYRERAWAWYRRKEYNKAIADCTEAIRLDPEYALAFALRGNAFDSSKQFEKAMADYDHAIRLDPTSAYIYNERGIAWYGHKDYDKAIADHSEAIRLDPTCAWPYSDRGRAWLAKKEYDKAFADYNQAIKLDPKDAYGFDNRSVAQMTLRRGGAVAGFHTVLELEGGKGELSTFADILGHLAARLAGDEVQAKAFLERAPGKLDVGAWPYPIVKFLRGEIDEPALLAAAIDDDKRTEARCFLGLDHLLKGHKDQALAHFRWVRDHGNPAFHEYTIALAELERLEKRRVSSAPDGN